ncbi:hypothetical protein V8C42DRAFT_303917 [Trichoderma barbatum]
MTTREQGKVKRTAVARQVEGASGTWRFWHGHSEEAPITLMTADKTKKKREIRWARPAKPVGGPRVFERQKVEALHDEAGYEVRGEEGGRCERAEVEVGLQYWMGSEGCTSTDPLLPT